MSENTFCVEIDPGLQISVSWNCHILKMYDFLHSCKVPSSPNGPWTSKWVLGSSLKLGASGWRGLRRKSILKNDLNKYTFSTMETVSYLFMFEKIANLFMHFHGFCSSLPPAPTFQFRFRFPPLLPIYPRGVFVFYWEGAALGLFWVGVALG